MKNTDIVKGIIEDLELLTEDDLPFDKCDEDCEDCESVCEEYFQEDPLTQIAILKRFTIREFNDTADKYKNSVCNVDIKTLIDIFGWEEDFVFPEKEKKDE